MDSVNIHLLRVIIKQWKVNTSEDLWNSGALSMPWSSAKGFSLVSISYTSLAFWDCQPSACAGEGKNRRANYKKQRRKGGCLYNRKVLRYPLM